MLKVEGPNNVVTMEALQSRGLIFQRISSPVGITNIFSVSRWRPNL